MKKDVKEIYDEYIALQNAHVVKTQELEEIVRRYQLESEPVKKDLQQLEQEMEAYKKKYIPSVSIAEVLNKKTGIKYLKASVRYFVDGDAKRRTSAVHLGKLSDFPLGKLDESLEAMAQLKAMELIIKKKDGGKNK
jgi:hypothetical protein